MTELLQGTSLSRDEAPRDEAAWLPAMSEQGRSRGPMLRIVTLLALTASFGGMPVTPAQAVEHAKAPKVAELPKIDPVNPPSVARAKQILKTAGFKKPGRVVPPKTGEPYPPAPAGQEYVATGWAQRVLKHLKRGHKTVTKVSYASLRPKSHLPVKSQIYIQPKLVSKKQTAQPGANPDKVPQTPVMSSPPEQAVPAPVNTPPIIAPPPEPKPLSPDVAMQISRWQATNTLYAPFLGGCTATVIRDAADKPIGASGAAHCNFRNAPRITGSDGQRYIVTNGPPVFERGEDVNNLTAFATAKQVILPTATNPSQDLMIMSFAGGTSTLDQALSAYKASLISDSEATVLPPAQRQGFVTGYPVQFNDYLPPVTKRAATEFKVLGLASIFTTLGQVITNSVVTGMQFAPGESRCSFGDSGAAGEMFPLQRQPNGDDKIIPRTLGSLIGFDDFTQVTPDYNGPAVRTEREGEYGFNLGDDSGTCDFDNEIPVAGAGAEVVNLVANAELIP